MIPAGAARERLRTDLDKFGRVPLIRADALAAADRIRGGLGSTADRIEVGEAFGDAGRYATRIEQRQQRQGERVP